MLVRACVVMAGLLIGLGVYSYGMFNTLHPTWSDFARVANCGASSTAATENERSPEPSIEDGDSTLCQIAPGKWINSPYGNSPFFFAIAIAFVSTLVGMHRSPLVRATSRSLGGFVTLIVLLCGTPMTLLGLQENFVEGTLTADWAIHVVVYSELITAAGGVLLWYLVLRPLILRRSGRR